jgi:hypothetical protein
LTFGGCWSRDTSRPIAGIGMNEAYLAADERARLAVADLIVAANDAIRVRTLRWEDVHDEVDAALLSRRWTGYAPSGMRQLEQARDDLEFANRARAEIVRISESARAGSGPDADSAGAQFVERLVALAAECERRAVVLRS